MFASSKLFGSDVAQASETIPVVDLRVGKSLSTETRMLAGIRYCSFPKAKDGLPKK